MTMRERSFVAFILTNRRPDRVVTYTSLLKSGYTGPLYLVVDDEDPTRADYIKRFGAKRVLVFSKAEVASRIDEGDNFQDRRAIIYARNACFDLARRLKRTYFIELDDDYSSFSYKFDHQLRYTDRIISNLDAVLDALLDYFKSIPALSIAMAQGGDFPGGARCSTWADGIKPRRKAMNTFICSTERPFTFTGRINEDVNTTAELGRRGGLFLTLPNIAVTQMQTQASAGGMSELYLDWGTYVKSFYSVMYAPSAVRIREMGAHHYRLHHHVTWGQCVPMILHAQHRKADLPPA